MSETPLIGRGNLTRTSLNGKVALVTGAGRGIGYEASRALAWLGARVILAEIYPGSGKAAAESLCRELGDGLVTFIQTDVGDESSVTSLVEQALKKYSKVDIVINNATVTPMGAVKDKPIGDWDYSYKVNLRGPVLLAKAFLPGMIERDYGVFVCVSSVGGAYMGPYEVLKTAQVDLCRTLDAELEGTNVIPFTIGPGLVYTQGALAAIKEVAPMYGKTVDEFLAMSADQIISVEEAGAGFAAAVALAPTFRGQEIGAKLALVSAGIPISEQAAHLLKTCLADDQVGRALELCQKVRYVLVEQSAGWAERPLFERQWLARDFKREIGMAAERCLEELANLERCLERKELDRLSGYKMLVEKVAGYHLHMQKLAEGYVKNEHKLAEQLDLLKGWQAEAQQLAALITA
ncbi:MAG: SDR family NAD(P)-dependent oxidoreductase [Anaerolineaceae bacterium]|nr:SDR family NAD(P)-dependent oxidoreductase [Anaerolineaceae bacterium]